MDLATLKRPSAWIPIAMSLSALALVLGYLAIYGVHRTGDEGAAAHTWQLLMIGQLPFIYYFAVWRLPDAPGKATPILLLQVVAALAALAPVYLLRL
jgi:hypothetical protein